MIPSPTLTAEVTSRWRPNLRGGIDSDELMAWYHAVLPGIDRGKDVVEVGVSWGRSLVFAAELLAAHAHRGRLYGVDPWRGPDAVPASGRSSMSYRAALASITEAASDLELEQVYIHRGTAQTFSAQLEGRPIALAMVDGDHSYEATRGDIVALLPVMAAGSIISGHDWCSEFPGVEGAVLDTLGGRPWRLGRLWAYQL